MIGHFPAQPGAFSAGRRRLFSAHRSRANSSSISKPDRHAAGKHRSRSSRRWKKSSAGSCYRRIWSHRLQHRRDPRLLLDLYAQLRPAHRLCAGEPEGGSQDQQLRIHGSRAKAAAARTAAKLSAYFQSGGLVDAVLNLGLPAPLDIQVSGSNIEEAHATASEIGAEDPRAARRERCSRAAGYRLSGAATGYRSRARQRTRLELKRKSWATSSPR